MAGDATLTMDRGYAIFGSDIRMAIPVIGREYDIVDSAHEALHAWNVNGADFLTQSQPSAECDSTSGARYLNGAENSSVDARFRVRARQYSIQASTTRSRAGLSLLRFQAM